MKYASTISLQLNAHLIFLILSKDKSKPNQVKFGKESHNFKFKSGKTKITIKNMEEKMTEIHKILLAKIEDLYK